MERLGSSTFIETTQVDTNPWILIYRQNCFLDNFMREHVLMNKAFIILLSVFIFFISLNLPILLVLIHNHKTQTDSFIFELRIQNRGIDELFNSQNGRIEKLFVLYKNFTNSSVHL